MSFWFGSANKMTVGGQSGATPTVEAEVRLKKLERHRPEYQLRGATHLADLDRRLRETAKWCKRHEDPGAVGVCLRPRSIAPHFLARDRWRSVDEVTILRRQELNGLHLSTKGTPQGRLLVYYPDEELSDGAAEVASQEFFDVYNAPPWGSWVGYFEDPVGDESRAYVLSWVPEELVQVANAGVEMNSEQCIAWLDQVNVGVRPLIEILGHIETH